MVAISRCSSVCLSPLLLLATGLLSLAAACSGKGSRPPTDSRAAASAGPPIGPTSIAHKSALTPPECDAIPGSSCFVDTAITHSEADPPDLSPTSQWIIFGAAGDSIEVSTMPPGAINSSLGEERDSLHNTAAQFRHRLATDGAFQVWVDLDQNISDTVAYTLRVVHRGPMPPPGLRATGEAATLILDSNRATDRYAIIPASIAGGVQSLPPWTVAVGTHKVALVGDSLYELCIMPCTRRDTVKLTQSRQIMVRFSSNGRPTVHEGRR
jgi:hypothetical protein